jgi:hypothetical protein
MAMWTIPSVAATLPSIGVAHGRSGGFVGSGDPPDRDKPAFLTAGSILRAGHLQRASGFH